MGDNGYNYTTLTYSSGPGFWSNVNNNTNDPHKPWLDASDLDVHGADYRQLSKIPTSFSFHGGEDVTVYATGPMAHLFHGVHEQSYVAHVMARAACIGRNSGDKCPVVSDKSASNAANSYTNLLAFYWILPLVVKLVGL